MVNVVFAGSEEIALLPPVAFLICTFTISFCFRLKMALQAPEAGMLLLELPG